MVWVEAAIHINLFSGLKRKIISEFLIVAISHSELI